MTAEARTAPAPARAAVRMPSAVRLGLARGGIELRQFFREREAVIFTFLFPPLLQVIFGAVFSQPVDGTGINFRQVFVPGMIASGIMSVSFQSLAIAVAVERDDGTLKRLRGTPMPKAAYFLGKIVVVFVAGVLEVALLLLIGTLFLGVHLPDTAGRWLTFGWVFVLGLTACALLGLVVSSIPSSGRAAPAVATVPFIVLQFISGVYFLYRDLPPWLQHVGALFPLKWMCQGLRSVFLPDWWPATQEVTGSWETARTALVLLAWTVGGLALALRTFRWKGRRDG
jgi:ABC-2 type transport system permease protein